LSLSTNPPVFLLYSLSRKRPIYSALSPCSAHVFLPFSKRSGSLTFFSSRPRYFLVDRHHSFLARHFRRSIHLASLLDRFGRPFLFLFSSPLPQPIALTRHMFLSLSRKLNLFLSIAASTAPCGVSPRTPARVLFLQALAFPLSLFRAVPAIFFSAPSFSFLSCPSRVVGARIYHWTLNLCFGS